MKRLLALLVLLSTAAHAGPRLKVITYNIHFGAGPHHARSADGARHVDEIASLLKAQNPDVVGLQEVVTGWWQAGGINQRLRLAERTGYAIHYKVANSYLGNNAGIAILTRHRVIEQRLAEVMRRGRYPVPGEPGRHEWAERRLAQAALIDVPGWGPIWFVNTHFHAGSGGNRRSNFDNLQSKLIGTLRGPVVVMGDLNSRTHDPAISLMKTADGGAFTDALEAHGVKAPRTFTDTPQHFRLDWMFFRPELMQLDHAYVTGWEQSDHEAIVAVFRRPEPLHPEPGTSARLLGVDALTASSGTR